MFFLSSLLLLIFVASSISSNTATDNDNSADLLVTCYEFSFAGACKAIAEFDASYAKYHSEWLALTLEGSFSSSWILEEHFSELNLPSLTFELSSIYTEKLLEISVSRLKELRPDLHFSSNSALKKNDCNVCSPVGNGGGRVCTTMGCFDLWHNEITISQLEPRETHVPRMNLTQCEDEALRYYWTTSEMRSHWRCSGSAHQWDCDHKADDNTRYHRWRPPLCDQEPPSPPPLEEGVAIIAWPERP